jgi:putative endonuclease
VAQGGVPKRYKKYTCSGIFFIDMPYFVYILNCADKTLYTGCTNNLKRRLTQHNSLKSGAHYTKIRRPVTLAYSEEFRTLSKAREREAQIKSLSRDKKNNLIKSKISP